MKLSRKSRRHLFYSAVLTSVTATVWWAWPQPPAPQLVTPIVGQTVELPAVRAEEAENPVTPAPVTETTPQPAPTQVEPVPKVRVYKVVEGDTVETIAAQFGLKPTSILWSNGIEEDSLLQIGQEVLVPATDGIIHEVTEGDTFWDIAVAYGVEVDDLIRANADISPDTFKPGDQLVIPGGEWPRRSTMLASRSGSERERSFGEPEPVPAPELEPEPSGETGSVVWPLTGVITEYFGWRTHPVYGTKNYHEGIDIGVPEGTPIRAIAAGRVIMAEWYGGYGLTLKVDHGNGLVARYSHDSKLLVGVGDYVKAGEVIAYSGNTGVSTGPHLDFGLFQDGVAVNPLGMLP